jgi:hypothetical protein
MVLTSYEFALIFINSITKSGVAESRDEPWRNWDIVELEVVK